MSGHVIMYFIGLIHFVMSLPAAMKIRMDIEKMV